MPKGPPKSFRFHDDIGYAVNALADKYDLGKGQIVALLVAREARLEFGDNWREAVRVCREADQSLQDGSREASERALAQS